MENKWEFTKSSGQIKGINDGSIEQFNGHILESLARENCQNSLDAKASDLPVKVNFTLKNIKSSDFPGFKDYLEMLKLSSIYWSNNEKASNTLNNAINCLNSASLPVLVISDYNTKGIENPYSDSDFTPWKALTVLDGGSTKEGNTGGSYGIGKNAPYAASSLRAIFYRTYNLNNEWAYQGLSRFVSYKDNDGLLTSGFGYYGAEKQKPINKIEELDSIFKRNEFGSDVYIFGFCGDENWKIDIVKAVLSNFVISIYEEKLVVVVDDIEIKKDTLKELFDNYYKSYKKDLNNAYSTYQVLTNEKTETFTKDFHDLGTLELKVLINPELNLNKKSLRTRLTGMKLFEQGKISKAIPFSAILRLNGDKLGKYFLSLEPATHDAWYLDKAKNKYEASCYISEIEKWEKEIILKKGANTSFGDVSVTGLSDNLLMNGVNKSNNKVDVLGGTIEDIFITQNVQNKLQAKYVSNDGNKQNDNNNEELPATLDPNGDPGGIRLPKGKKKKEKKEHHNATFDPNGKDKIKKKLENGNELDLKSLRIIKQSDKKYEMIFSLPSSVLEGHISILSVGENNRSKKINVLNATSISNISITKVKNSDIHFTNIKMNEKVKFSFELLDNQNFAMEVVVYEHQK